jgi:long-chain acyl-CoA synthetase
MNKNAPLYEVRPISDLRDMLEQSRKLYADQTAFLVKDKRGEPYRAIPYSQYAADVDALGTAFADLGLVGGRIAILGEARYEWYVTYLATVNGTGVVVPLDKELPVQEIRTLLQRSYADAVVYLSSKKPEIDKIRADNRAYVTSSAWRSPPIRTICRSHIYWTADGLCWPPATAISSTQKSILKP